jgi:4-diphosphocytidyl-2-C-methyl-D-erythritol kinase
VPLPPLHLVLVNPGIHVSAADAYRHLRTFSGPLELEAITRCLATGDEPRYENSLQDGVLMLEPGITRVLAALRSAGVRGVLMSGSGSTCFGVADSAEHAHDVAVSLQEAYPAWWVSATGTLS